MFFDQWLIQSRKLTKKCNQGWPFFVSPSAKMGSFMHIGDVSLELLGLTPSGELRVIIGESVPILQPL